MININEHNITVAEVNMIEKVYDITLEKMITEEGCKCIYMKGQKQTPESKLFNAIFGPVDEDIKKNHTILGTHFFIQQHIYVEFYKNTKNGDLYLIQYEWLPFTDAKKKLLAIFKFPIA